MYVLVVTIFMVSLVELLANARVGAQFINGATTASCTSLSEPGFTAQTSPSPYFLLLSQDTYSPGGTIEVTLQSSQTQVNSFTAIIIQARRNSGESFPVGRFDIQGLVGLQYVICTDVLTQRISTDGTVTNVDDVSKSLPIVLSWVAPGSSVGDVVFVTTVVRSNGTFWEAVQSQVLSGLQSPPVITCPDSVVVTSLAGNVGNAAAWDSLTCVDAGDGTITTSVCVPPSGSFFPGVDVNTVTCTCTDSGGLSDECTFSVTVTGFNTPPVITCPTTVVVTSLAGNVGNFVSWNPLTCVDAEDGTITTSVCVPASGSFFPGVGVNTVSCTCTDSGGLSDECTFSVTIAGFNTPPVITCPTTVVVTSLANNVGIIASWNPPTCVDAEDGTITTSVCVPASGSFFLGVGVNTVTCTCTYSGGLSDECTFSVTVAAANTPPVITCPVPVTVSSLANNVGNVATWLLPTCTDLEQDNNTLTTSCVPASGSFFNGVQSTNVTCTCMDNLGLSDTCVFTVTVEPANTPPVITCPAPVTVSSIASNVGNVATWLPPTCTDLEQNDDTLKTSCNPSSGSFFNGVQPTSVTCTCVDSEALSDTCVFTVTVETANTPPVITCPAPVTVSSLASNVGNVATWLPPTCTNLEQNDDTLKTSCNPSSGSFFNGVQPTRVTCTCVDNGGLSDTCVFTVTVKNGVSTDGILCPRRAITMDSQGILTSVEWKTPIIHTKNNGETIALRQESSFDSGLQFPLGATEVVYSSDEAMCRFWVIINDIQNTTDVTPPTIYDCPKGPLKYEIKGHQISFTPTWKEPFAIDESCLPVVNQSSHSSGDQLEIGNTTVVFNFTDSGNNSAQCIFVISVTVMDVKVPSPKIVFCPTSIRYNLAAFVHGVIITWNEPVIENFVQLHQTHFSGDFFKIGTTQVIYTAINSVGEEAICRFSVDVKDVTPPKISRCPSGKSVRACRGSARVTWLEPTAEDNSGFHIQQIQSHTPGVSVFREGTKTVSYTFEDIFGNTAVCSFNITVHRNSCRSITQTMISFYIYIALGLLLFLLFILICVSCYIDKHSGSRRDNGVNNLSLQELTT